VGASSCLDFYFLKTQGATKLFSIGHLEDGDHDVEDDDRGECDGHEGRLPAVGVHLGHHVGENEDEDDDDLIGKLDSSLNVIGRVI
jgi:hypothetical protein